MRAQPLGQFLQTIGCEETLAKVGAKSGNIDAATVFQDNPGFSFPFLQIESASYRSPEEVEFYQR